MDRKDEFEPNIEDKVRAVMSSSEDEQNESENEYH